MPLVIGEHRQIVLDKIVEFQDSLAAEIDKFKNDLEVYAQFVDQLQYNGDIELLPKYHKKATQLDKR